MPEHLVEIVLIGCLLIGALAMVIYRRDTAQGSRAVQVFLLAAASLVAVWLIRHPNDAEVVIERLVKDILALATRLF